MEDLIDRQAAIDALYHHFPKMSRTECAEVLHEVPSAQPDTDTVARDIATILQNEQDMRVILKNAQPTHDDGSNALDALDCVAQRKGKIIIRSTNMFDGEDCYCSECDHWALMPDYKFCPYCGIAFEDVITEGGDDETD